MSSGSRQDEHGPCGTFVSNVSSRESIEAEVEGVGQPPKKSIEDDGDRSDRSLS
jgi:hypothetical protein